MDSSFRKCIRSYYRHCSKPWRVELRLSSPLAGWAAQNSTGTGRTPTHLPLCRCGFGAPQCCSTESSKLPSNSGTLFPIYGRGTEAQRGLGPSPWHHSYRVARIRAQGHPRLSPVLFQAFFMRAFQRNPTSVQPS